MGIMNPELESLVKFMNKKRKREEEEIDPNNIIKELRYISLEGLQEVIKEYKLSGRKLTSLLGILEDTFNSCKDTLINSQQNNEKEFNLLIIEIIQDLKIEIYSEGNNFDIKKYLKIKKMKI